MAEGIGFLAQIGERLGLRASPPSERDRMVTQLGTRAGRESLMQEAVRGGAPEASPERRDVLQAMIGFHGRNELFMEARTAASRAGRPFEEFGEGELKRYNALEAGRPVGPHAASGPLEGSARDQVLEGLATRDGRAAFLGEAQGRSGAAAAGDERGALLDQAREPGGRATLLAEAESHAAREGRGFEPLGFREGWARAGGERGTGLAEGLEIGGAPNRSRAEVGALIQSIDQGLAQERPQAGAENRRTAGLER